VHAAWIVPGGVASLLAGATRDRILSELPTAKPIADRTLSFSKGAIDNDKEEIEFFGSFPTMYPGMVDRKGTLQFYDGELRFRSSGGEVIEDQIAAEDYAQWIGEASLRESYLKALYFQPQGFPHWSLSCGPVGPVERGRPVRDPPTPAASSRNFTSASEQLPTARSFTTTLG